ncbi:MAG: 4-hydroxy-tetrahydrodipicolinate reductase [Bacteroidota bacterium]|nr:4-hydroxy-tetrahydrodipicolinate reductase [Bacteroidota bacterium]
MNNLPKIAIVGYGAMGKIIESLAIERGFEITDIFDVDTGINPSKHYDFDIAIEFTEPDSAIDNFKILSSMGKSIITGTTGWNNNLEEVREFIEKSGVGFIYSSNFSIGMQMFFRIIRSAARLINNTPDYDVMLHEIHHSGKKDSPSGTALALASILTDEINRKTALQQETMHGLISPDMLHISSTRGGSVTGQHTIYVDSSADSIELSHKAKDRSGFALGALTAAQWLAGRHGFYNFDTILDEIWK